MEVVFETKIVSLRIAEVMVEVVTDEKEKAEVARQHEVAMQAAEEKKKTTFAEVYGLPYIPIP